MFNQFSLTRLFARCRTWQPDSSVPRRQSRQKPKRLAPTSALTSADLLEDRTLLAAFALEQLTTLDNDFVEQISMSGDGTRFAYVSKSDLLGTNPDRDFDIFFTDVTTGELKQITAAENNFLFGQDVFLTTDGNRVIFESPDDLLGTGTGGTFIFDVTTDTLTQLPLQDGFANPGGTHFAFSSSSNPLGTNADGNFELFLYNVATATLTQETNTVGTDFSYPAALSSDGTRVAYYSDDDPFGTNADNNTEVFLLDVTTDTLTQVTNSIGGLGGVNFAMNADGTRFVFALDVNPDPDVVEDELFLFDTSVGTQNQITSLGMTRIENVSTNPDGTKIVFGSLPGDFSGSGGILLLDTTTSTLTTLRNGDQLNQYGTIFHTPAISADSMHVVFRSIEDPLGTNRAQCDQYFVLNLANDELTQITETKCEFADDPSISADGNLIVFESNTDPLGTNSDLSTELFLLNTITGTMTQLTNRPAFDALRQAFMQPSINSDATRIAFISDADPLGSNTDGNDELFLLDTVANTLLQITETLSPMLPIDEAANGLITDDPALSADGTTLVFRSNADLLGTNADKNDEIFLFDIGTGILTQVTNNVPPPGARNRARGSVDPKINGDGTRVAFGSTADRLGTNPGGMRFGYLFDTTTSTLTQISDGADSIDGAGTLIPFSSTFDPLGTNADHNVELFLFNATTGITTQLTNTTGFFSTAAAAISADGKTIAYASEADLTGGNADGSFELFRYDIPTGLFSQVTKSSGFSRGPDIAISANGSRIVFASTADFLGQNRDRELELYLATAPQDYGDAPTAAQSGFTSDYPTSLPDAARHMIVAGGPFIGATPPDAEANGIPHPMALGDDSDGVDDEDLTDADQLTIELNVGTQDAFFSVWVDFNRNGSWEDDGEKIIADQLISAGSSGEFPIAITLPPEITPGPTFVRARISTQSGLTSLGFARDGEVEDFQVILQPADGSSIHGRKWNDLNADGTRQSNEPWLNGWTIELTDRSGNVIQSAVTMDMDLDNSGTINPETERGWYWFDALNPNTHQLTEVVQPGWRQTAPYSDVSLRAWQLDQQLQLVSSGKDWFNWGGLGEKWLYSKQGWHYITPDGSLFRWNVGSRTGFSGTPVSQFDTSYYMNLPLLYDAQFPRTSLVTVNSGQATENIDFGNQTSSMVPCGNFQGKGNVVVTTTDRDLLLTGDAWTNGIAVYLNSAGRVTVSGLGMTLINGRPDPLVTQWTSIPGSLKGWLTRGFRIRFGCTSAPAMTTWRCVDPPLSKSRCWWTGSAATIGTTSIL